MWHFGDGMGWWMLFGGAWMMLFWAAVVGLVVWLVIRLTRRSDTNGRDDGRRTPLEIARERYARGEISREEFEQIRKDLST
jgi:putative membrane protein